MGEWLFLGMVIGVLIHKWWTRPSKEDREMLDACTDVLIYEMIKTLEMENGKLNEAQKAAVENKVHELIRLKPKVMIAKAKYLMENPT